MRLVRLIARRAGIVRISWNALQACWDHLLNVTADHVMEASLAAWGTSPALAHLDSLDAACERVNRDVCASEEDEEDDEEEEDEEEVVSAAESPSLGGGRPGGIDDIEPK